MWKRPLGYPTFLFGAREDSGRHRRRSIEDEVDPTCRHHSHNTVPQHSVVLCSGWVFPPPLQTGMWERPWGYPTFLFGAREDSGRHRRRSIEDEVDPTCRHQSHNTVLCCVRAWFLRLLFRRHVGAPTG